MIFTEKTEIYEYTTKKDLYLLIKQNSIPTSIT
jgi:hypothetical protein